MLEIIALIILIIGLGGMAVIIVRAIPNLTAISFQEVQPDTLAKNNKNPLSKILFLQKILSKLRILILKIDNKTNEWMKRLREKSQENKIKFSNDYWNNLKK